MVTDLFNPHLDVDVAYFYLWNLSGQLVGYQSYRYLVTAKRLNDPKDSRYFTYQKLPTLAVFGLESLMMRSDILFVVEGVFDASRFHARGYPAIAVLSCDTRKDMRNWFGMLNRKVVVVCDNDENNSGGKLAKFGDASYFLLNSEKVDIWKKRYPEKLGYKYFLTDNKDVGDLTDAEVDSLIETVYKNEIRTRF